MKKYPKNDIIYWILLHVLVLMHILSSEGSQIIECFTIIVSFLVSGFFLFVKKKSVLRPCILIILVIIIINRSGMI